jgi:hypothetical protein
VDVTVEADSVVTLASDPLVAEVAVSVLDLESSSVVEADSVDDLEKDTETSETEPDTEEDTASDLPEEEAASEVVVPTVSVTVVVEMLTVTESPGMQGEA